MSQPPRIDGCREADALAIELARANTHLHFFKRLHENYRELGGAKDFWDFTLAAHIGMALLQLARVYDTRREGLNMQRMLRAVDEKLLDKADRQSLMDHTCQCAKQDRLVGKLKEWRDNVIAHYNCDCALAPRDNFWNMYSWELCEVQELIDRAFRVLEWCAQVGGHPRTFQRLVEGKDGCQSVLNRLRPVNTSRAP